MDEKFIIEHTVGNLYWKDKQGKYLGCNNEYAYMLGLNSPQEIIGKTDRDLFLSILGEEKLSHIIKTDQEIINTGIEKSLIEEGTDKAGKLCFYFTKKIPLKNKEGQIIGIMGTSLNITKEKQAEVMKTEFLANMRHDIRTPLTGIIGFSEVLKGLKNIDPAIKEHLDNLSASAHALTSFLNEVLEAMRVSSGEIPLVKKKFNLVSTLEKVRDLYRARAAQKGLNLKLELNSNLPRFVVGDKIRLHRVVLEFVGNALNFTDKGEIKISAELAKQENRELIVKFRVQDTGIGIPKDKQEDIYLQFKRLTPSYEGIYKGAGLGLFIVKQFINELEGEIYVESTLGQGTCFTCLIPLQKPLLDDDSGINPDEEAKDEPYLRPLEIVPSVHSIPTLKNQAETNKLEAPKVLVVEDNRMAQIAARGILKNLGCEVELASSGEEAINLCKEKKYELIFMDIGLGNGMDGFEVTHFLRLQNEMSDTAIVALSGHAAEDGYRQRCIDVGMNAVIAKPLTVSQAEAMTKAFFKKTENENSVISETHIDLPDNDEALFQLEQFPLLDANTALRTQDNPSNYYDMVVAVYKQLPGVLVELKQNFEKKDYIVVEQIIHKIKHSVSDVSAIRMKYACQYIERYRKAGETKLFELLYKQLIRVIEQTKNHVKEWIIENSTKNE